MTAKYCGLRDNRRKRHRGLAVWQWHIDIRPADLPRIYGKHACHKNSAPALHRDARFR
jgi:hypothetical protein